MSFSGTPLGQGRRLDHHTFLGKPPSNGTFPPSSYAYGAPALGSRSPPKPTSPSRPRNGHQALEEAQDDEQETTLQRFAKLKQRESAAGDPTVRSGGTNTNPKNPVTNVDPTKLPPYTSVNTANALFQAAANSSSSSMSTYTNPHNAAWASSSRERGHVPRSTSQEYENTVSNQTYKRLAAPPDKLGRGPPSTTVRKPPSKSTSSLHVPDSEGEGDSRGLNGRAKSPLETSLTFAKNALGAAAFYVRQRSREPEDRSVEHPPANGTTNGNDSSYDYAEEEQAFQSQKQRNNAAHKRNRMSLDNKAYKPSLSDEEESEYSDNDKTRRRRKKGKKGPAGGPLTSLPVVGADKRRRRKGHGPKGTHDGPDDDDSDSENDTQIDIHSAQLPSGARTSNPPLSRASISRFSQEPSLQDQDDSLASAHQGLDSIPEIDEGLLPLSSEPYPSARPRRRSRSRSHTPAPPAARSRFSIGGLLGSLVHVIFKLAQWTVSRIVSILSMFTFLFGQVFGTTFDIMLRRPVGWLRRAGESSLWRYLFPSVVILLAWYALRGAELGSYVPSLTFPSKAPVYQAPMAPPVDISEFAQRLLIIENALSGLSLESERTKAKSEDGLKFYSDLLSRVSQVEGRLLDEAKKLKDVESKARDSVTKTINSVKQDVDLLHSQLIAQQRQYERDQKSMPTPGGVTDEDARNLIKALEERVGSVEGGVKEALEIGKKAAAVIPVPAHANAPLPGAAWWNKLVSSSPDSKSILQIKSADGQDVSALISHMVDAAVSLSTKDGGVAKPDFALFSGGARVIPRLTSARMEISPRTFFGQVKTLFTGIAGYESLPPAVALHPDTYSGHCYPFEGTQGQLGVRLAVPVYVEEVTVDHVAKELAYDLRSAPREMEVWGLLEGRENVEKVAEWRAHKASLKSESSSENGDTSLSPPPPPTLPADAEFIRLANFTYDIHAPKHVQTFPIDPEIRDLGIDFGIVVLRVLSNWGQRHFTCLYRFRVHGTPMGDVLEPVGSAE
ncbi:hypothetical protein CVT26_007783, partial [Gymnopilus dilepis]